MKSIKGVCWFFILAILAVPAVAGTVNMQFNGLPTDNNYWGVPSYPYDVSVNGGADQWMMCIGYYEHIEGGETWQANVVSVASLDPTALAAHVQFYQPGATNLLYYQAAYLFEMAAADKGTDSNVNAAIWYLMEGAPSLTPEAAALVAQAESQSYTRGEFPNVLLYEAIPGTENTNLGTAQDFLQSTPEPGTLMMFGSGMIALAGMLGRQSR